MAKGQGTCRRKKVLNDKNGFKVGMHMMCKGRAKKPDRKGGDSKPRSKGRKKESGRRENIVLGTPLAQ